MATKKGFPQAGIGRKIQKINDQEVSQDVTKINVVNNRDNFVAGKTRENFNKWSTITNDKWILQTISGYKVELCKTNTISKINTET